ncbi:transmembrane protease serine 11C-like [Rhinatrema bivittatum]|uniref:transmembrane protease serine 11C-like n=1 Tax=Rhinatrema bivittatum TaxID=194408 RepID=UPI00112C9170|nr:transmembrane protease serine 11C-like [Rhinatrema bivittatum]
MPTFLSTASTTKMTTTTTPFVFTGCGRRILKPLSRILGGTAAAMGDWPWQASLRFLGSHSCGASLVSDSWLVTAAHCFEWGTDTSSWTVSLGTINLTPNTRLELAKIIIHENYNTTTYSNDIALLQLSKPITFTPYIQPVCLPDAGDIFLNESNYFVTGWGTGESVGLLSSVLQQAQVKLINTDICNSAAVYNNSITSSMLCAGYLTGGIDSCQGDSGGPLVSESSNGTWYLVGIVSWGRGCGVPDKPGVYSKVTALRSWITSKTGL